MTMTASYIAAATRAAASGLCTSAAVCVTGREGANSGGWFEGWARRRGGGGGGGGHVSAFFLSPATKTKRWSDGGRNGGGEGERLGYCNDNGAFLRYPDAATSDRDDYSTLGTCQISSAIGWGLRTSSNTRSRPRKVSRHSRQLSNSSNYFAGIATSTIPALSSSSIGGSTAAESPIVVDPVEELHRPLDHVFEAQQFDRELLMKLFDLTRQMEKITPNSSGSRMLEGFIMATLFYEPSTRTRLSFESAMKRLGGNVLTTENAREFSSAAKGETLEDTIRTVETYSDIIVLRHFESGAAKRAAAVSSVPLINAGDGPGQHPTQALLDVYTIQREIGRLDNIKVGLVGDLANGRTVRSLAYLLSKFDNVQMYFIAPEVARMKDDIKEHLTANGVQWEETGDLMDVASKVDVIYQTRIQRERFADRVEEYDQARGKYIVDKKTMEVLPERGIVMHPLPRLDEITEEVDTDPRAAYFRQARNGLHIRMALLKLLLLGW
ncbi:hypothetical protein CBR_g4282 [Chara braunii]|uniref:aspartate carbamoyltransferase n=1 Tax=Chara braunii TaxID=69332 RepID=A0A388JR91_CHABU|nr:hypothetical protein CBR_g4282 [Chara braunii]|eukprot:GBG60326.1 hypothetical protein CBR_g4282 [Chara braunii]